MKTSPRMYCRPTLDRSNAHEANEALLLAAGRDLEHVVLAGERHLLARDGEVDVGERGDLGAVDRVLASSERLGANGGHDLLDVSLGADQERRARVGDDLAATLAEAGRAPM